MVDSKSYPKKEVKGKFTLPPLPELLPIDFSDVKNMNRSLGLMSIPGFGVPVLGQPALPGFGSSKAAAPQIDFNQLIQIFGPILAGLILQWMTPRVVAPAPIPIPVPPPIAAPPTPPVAPVPPPVSEKRVIASLRNHWIGWEDYSMRAGEKRAFHHSINASKIISGQELVGRGYRGHADVTPLDQWGKPFFNSDLGRFPDLFAKDPGLVHQDPNGKWTCGEGNNRINHYIIIDGHEYGPMGDMVEGRGWEEQPWAGLTSETDDGAMTPVVLINYDVPLGQEISLAYRAGYVGWDGKEIPSDPTKAVRVKAWEVVGQEA